MGQVLTINNYQLDHALTGMPYPARRWQLLGWADFNCASRKLRDVLAGVPDRVYKSKRDVVEVIAAAGKLREEADSHGGTG